MQPPGHVVAAVRIPFQCQAQALHSLDVPHISVLPCFPSEPAHCQSYPKHVNMHPGCEVLPEAKGTPRHRDIAPISPVIPGMGTAITLQGE